jgi:hypothetical protein
MGIFKPTNLDQGEGNGQILAGEIWEPSTAKVVMSESTCCTQWLLASRLDQRSRAGADSAKKRE